MVVKTRLTKQDFDQILSYYNLGTFFHFHPIAQGTVQTSYILQTSQGKYVFRYYENRAHDSVLFEGDLLTYLTEQKYPCPAPIPDREGSCVGTYRLKPFMLIEFMQGHPIEIPTEYHQAQLIQMVAELARLTHNYKPRGLAYRLNYTIPNCRALALQEAEKIGTQDAINKYAWVDAQLAALDLPKGLPKGVCHCDFHFSNILYCDDQIVGLVDFDDANYTYLVFDLVNLIDYWAWPFQADHLDLLAARKIVKSYHELRPLNDIEQHNLIDVHKLSILFDCIWFFSRGSVEDFYEKRKMAYLDALTREGYVDALF